MTSVDLAHAADYDLRHGNATEPTEEYCAFCDEFREEMSGEEFPKRMQFGYEAGKAAYRTVSCEACSQCAAMLREESLA